MKSERGGELRSIEGLYDMKIVGIAEHLENAAPKHRIQKLVREREKEMGSDF